MFPIRSAMAANLILLCADAAPALAANVPAQAPASSPTPAAINPELASYDIGLLLGNQIVQNGLVPMISREALMRGLQEGLAGKRPSPEQRESGQQFSRSARDSLAKRNETLAHEFLAKNTREKGIITLASGLQYRVLAPGDPHGPQPGPLDQVTVRYRASLADGTELDRSDEHAQPAVFRMNAMIPGWHEALSAMPPGAKWQVFVPPELGYGANSPPPIPPGSLMVYELELLRVDAARRQVPPELMHSRPSKAAPTP
jgi:FKBP-type peptidyl-prolyl cis-trans isomerase